MMIELNEVLYNDNIGNGDVNSVNQSGITGFEITSPLLLQHDEEIGESIWTLKDKFLIMF